MPSLGKGDWAFTCRIVGKNISRLEWMFVDYVLRLSRSDRSYDKGVPCEGVQVWPTRRYPPPMFRLDASFVAGFKQAVKDYGLDRIEGIRTGRVPTRFLTMLAEQCM